MTAAIMPTRAAHHEVDTIAALITGAALVDPVTAWLIPDIRQRRAVLTKVITIWATHTLNFGDIDILPDRTAAAIWLHRHQPIPPPPNYNERLAAACGPNIGRFRALEQILDAHRPRQPHHHLATLSVQPRWQSTGRGSALLEAHHARLDHIGVPAYITVTNPSVCDWYAHHGYLPRQPIHLPAGPTVYPMWRPASHRIKSIAGPKAPRTLRARKPLPKGDRPQHSPDAGNRIGSQRNARTGAKSWS